MKRSPLSADMSGDTSLVVKPRAFATPGLDTVQTAIPRGEIIFPPLAPPGDVVIPDLPKPSAYWNTTPAVMGSPLTVDETHFFTRKRVTIGLASAAALHGLLFLGWWLSPPLRIKAEYSPDRWVPVWSVPTASKSPTGHGAVPATVAPVSSKSSSAVEIITVPPKQKALQSP